MSSAMSISDADAVSFTTSIRDLDPEEEAKCIRAGLEEVFPSVGDKKVELTKVQFRKLWSVIQGTMNREQQGDLDDLFDTLDVNGDDSLSIDEVDAFLGKTNLSTLPPCNTFLEKITVLAMEHDSDALDIKKAPSQVARDMIFGIFVYKIVMLIACIMSVVLLIVDAHPTFYTTNSISGTDFTRVMDGFVVTLFTFDVVIKVIAVKPLFRLGIITDIACILPFYVALMRGTNDDLQALRSFRIFYVLKVPTYTRVFHIGKSRIPPLHVAVLKGFKQFCKAFSVLCCLLSISSACMFFAELHDASYDASVKKWRRLADAGTPDAGELIQFQSIPDAMWWSMVTMTTVGYGDYIPVTSSGKVVAGVTMLCGLIFVGFVSNTLTGAFSESQDLSTIAARNEALRLKFRSALLRIEHKGLDNFHSEEAEQTPLWVDDFKVKLLQKMETLHNRITELEGKLADKENVEKNGDAKDAPKLFTSDARLDK